MCITEVKISNKNYHFYNHKDYHTIHNLPENHNDQSPKEGLIILIHKDLSHSPPPVTHIHPGRTTCFEINLENKPLKCFCIYGPSQGDSASLPFYEDLFNNHPPDPMQNTIYIGDFNVVQNPAQDRRNTKIKYHKPKTHKLLTNCMLDHALVDPWRTQHPNTTLFSWDNRTSASRIDFALVSANLYHQVTDTTYTAPPVNSDHKVVTLSINLNKFRTGRGYPKVKNTLYHDPAFITKINSMITETMPSHPNTRA